MTDMPEKIESEKIERARRFLQRGGLDIDSRSYRKQLIAREFLGLPPVEINDIERLAMKFGGNHRAVQRLIDKGLVVVRKSG